MDESIGLILMWVFQAGNPLMQEELHTCVVYSAGFKIRLLSRAPPHSIHPSVFVAQPILYFKAFVAHRCNQSEENRIAVSGQNSY